MITRLLPLLKLAAGILVLLFLFDATVFRSGAYRRVMEPESTAGTTLGSIYAAENLHEPKRKNIIVLGNSQIGEGFSAATADEASGRTDLHFINAAIPGTSPRVWDYVLREVDPNANRFAAVVLMVSYDTWGIQADPANYPLDISYLTPLLRVSDASTFPSSFNTAEQRERAWRAVLLPLQPLHEDVLALLANPSQRLKKVGGYYAGWLAAVQQYQGHSEAVPTLEIDPITGQPHSWNGIPVDLKARLEAYLAGLHHAGYGTPQLQNDANAYTRRWLGGIAERYQAHQVPVIIFVVPRGPFHAQSAPIPAPAGAVAELRDAGLVQALPGDAFVQFEKPQFFFDTLHMNHTGREGFSRLFAQKIAPLVH